MKREERNERLSDLSSVHVTSLLTFVAILKKPSLACLRPAEGFLECVQRGWVLGISEVGGF